MELSSRGMSVYEPIIVGAVGGELWLEAHPDVYRRDRRDAVGCVTIEAARRAPNAILDLDVIRTTLKERIGGAVRIVVTAAR
jgi:hypothetical protein